jgi:sarcosine oxidase, subunit alpha
MNRLGSQPGERIDRNRELSFTFDGATVSAFAGDTITSALLASGRTVLSRSFKYHRPRGELCGSGDCANSLFQVDGWPGIRGCSEPARQGTVVEHQNSWPTLRFDLMRATDLFGGPFTPVGFYYKTFIWPRRMWPAYEKVLRNAAGLGRLPPHQDEREWRTEYRRRHCDVMVIGGGVAGLAAAIRAAELGADVVLADQDVEPGGALLVDGRQSHAHDLVDRARAAGVELLVRAPALGYFDGLVPVWQDDTLHQVRARQHVAATGALEQPLVFPDNDLPGVMLAGGAQRLAALYAVRPGSRAVVATTNDRGLIAALALREAGVQIEAVADLRRRTADTSLGEMLRAAGIRLLTETTVVRAHGRNHVAAATLAQVDSAGASIRRTEHRIDCDLLAISGGVAPASSLLLQAGAGVSYQPNSGLFLTATLPTGVHAAGAVIGHADAVAAELSGAVAGAEAALALGLGRPRGPSSARRGARTPLPDRA